MRHLSLLLWAALAWPLHADTILIDFEGLTDGTPVTGQFTGVAFSNATVLTSGISLNEFEFPPRSGANVVFDDGGPISISFLTPVLSFSGYFTHGSPLSLAAFDVLNNQVATAASLFSNNEALSGNPGSSPSELLAVDFSNGISRVILTGDPAGSSFTLDDATIMTPAAVPEPSTFSTFLFFYVFFLLTHHLFVMRAKT